MSALFKRTENEPSNEITGLRGSLSRLKRFWAEHPSHAAKVGAGRVTSLRHTALVGTLDFDRVSRAARAYMDQADRANRAALAEDGVGLRYGEKSPYAKMSATERFNFVKAIVEKKNPAKANDAYVRALMARMRPTSCIGYTMEALKAGYVAAGQSARWDEIAAAVRAKGTIGTVLMSEMQNDGWEAVYWNADTRTWRGPTAKPADRQRRDDHLFFTNRFMTGGVFKPGLDAEGNPIPRRDYYGTFPQHALVNYFAAPAGREPRVDPAVLSHIKRASLWVGVAASGYHTFAGSGVRVRDSHVSRDPDDRTNLENRPFEELDLAWDPTTRAYKTSNGKPVYSEEQSGIMLIPPGTWTE